MQGAVKENIFWMCLICIAAACQYSFLFLRFIGDSPSKALVCFTLGDFKILKRSLIAWDSEKVSKQFVFCFVWCLTFMWAGSYKRNFYLLHCITIHCSLRLKKEIKGNSSEPIKHVGSGDKKPFFSIHYNKLLYRKYDTFSTSLILFLCFL